jgi:hypothetical protein
MRIVSTLTLALLVATAGLLSACGTESLTPATACVIDNDCERGQACVDGLCTASSALADATGSGDATEADTATGSGADTTVEDTTPADTTPVDSGSGADTSIDTTVEDTTPIDTTPAEPTWTLAITTPVDRDAFRTSSAITLTGQLRGDAIDFSTFDLAIASSINGSLGIIHPDAAGAFSLPLVGLRPGRHTLSVRAVALDGLERTASVVFGICPDDTVLDFTADLDPAQWLVRGDTTRDPGGWLELTGLAQGRAGSIYYLGDTLAEGDVEINLRISTGACPTPGPCSSFAEGADGFAMNIWSVASVPELESILDIASNGGGLGYGVSGLYGDRVVDSFHIEFDTYYNRNDIHTDPTSLPHIGITQNGDPENHLIYYEAASLENNEWHDITLSIQGSRVRVMYDGTMAIDQDVPGLSFKGGFLGFSGSTGYYYNYHRIDDLQIVQSCTF